MSTFAAFVLGLLIGWVVEWIIDWIYWRRKTAVLQDEAAGLRERLKQSEARSADMEHQLNLQKANLTNLQERLASTETELSQARIQPTAPKPAGETLTPRVRDQSISDTMEAPVASEAMSFGVENAPTAEQPVISETAVITPEPTRAAAIERDDLVVIKGIGPVIARQLNQAGIYSFADLAALTPARLRELVGDVISRLADEESIIEQAKHLAELKRSGG